MSELSERDRELVALGAAIACNCLPCIEFHVPAARKSGLSDVQIQEAVRLADTLRRVPARLILQTALARADESGSEVAETTSHDCGCAASRRDAGSDRLG